MIICWSVFLVVFADSYMLMFIKCVILYIRKDIRCCWKSVEDIGKWERWYVNFDYEQFFIQHFIVKNKRERFQFELSNKIKRQNAISRFAHNTWRYIDERKLIYSGSDIAWDDLKR